MSNEHIGQIVAFTGAFIMGAFLPPLHEKPYRRFWIPFLTFLIVTTALMQLIRNPK